MIHNGWTIALGDKRVMQDTAALLDKVDASILNAYAGRSSASREQLVQWMNDETWFNAQEAVEHGFADRLAGKVQKDAQASARTFNLRAYEKTPAALLEEPAPQPNAAALMAANRRRLQLLQID